jgi:DNA-directed RNA polymerase specialized sigma24 family protein
VTSAEQQFTEFATLAAPRLRRTAFLLCGDWHTAEDLTQTALAKVFMSWRRINKKDAVQAYATRTLVNSYLAGRRRKRVTEVLLSRLPDRAVPPQAPELRLMMLDDAAGTVTPITTATNTPGPAIKVGKQPTALVLVP